MAVFRGLIDSSFMAFLSSLTGSRGTSKCQRDQSLMRFDQVLRSEYDGVLKFISHNVKQ